MPGIDRPAITDEQQKLADFVTQLLRSAGAVFRQTQLGDHEPWYRFVLAPTGDGNVSVSVHIAPDTFELNVNGADLRLARMDFAHGTEWVEACTHTLTQLAENDLTIRLRRTLFGKRVGAVQIPTGRGDNHWMVTCWRVVALASCTRTRTGFGLRPNTNTSDEPRPFFTTDT